MTCSIPLTEFRPSSAETGKEALRANLQWKAWSLILGQGRVFLSFFKLGYYITYMHWISYCMKARKLLLFFLKQIPTALWDQIQLQCKWLVWPSVIHSVCVFVCVWLQWRYIYTEDQNHEPCWQPAASAARNKTRNKCFMKQTYTSLPYFSVTSLLPAAASNHLGFCTFSFNSNNFFRKVT